MKNVINKTIIIRPAMALMILALILGAVNAAITSITVTAPNGGEIWSGTQDITWDAVCTTPEDDYFDIQWEYDGGARTTIQAYLRCSENCTPNGGDSHSCSWEWNTTTVSDGDAYRILVRNANNISINDLSDSDFTIDNTPPGTVTDLKSTTHLTEVWDTNSQNNDITLTWDDADGGVSDLNGYFIVCNYEDDTIPDDDDTPVAAGVETYQCKEMDDSNNIYFHIRAVDNAGNWGDTERIGPFYIDTTPPTSTITNPTQGSFVNSVTDINGNASDNLSGVAKVEIAVRHDGNCLNLTKDGWNDCGDEVWITADGTTTWSVTGITATFINDTATIERRATDAAGNVQTPQSITFNFDDIAPTVLDVNSDKPNDTYGVGEDIYIKVKFSENVIVDISSGRPYLKMETGQATQAPYESGSGSNTLVFRYTVEEGDNSLKLDYTTTEALKLNDGTIKDNAGNDANLILPEPGEAGSLGHNKNIVIDTTQPTVENVYSTTADGTYKENDEIIIRVKFDKDVIVTGTPELALNAGAESKAVYDNGSGDDTLSFKYTVGEGHTTSGEELEYDNINALTLNEGTIQDAVGNNANLELPEPGTAGSLGDNNNIIIDAVVPATASVTLPLDEEYYNELTEIEGEAADDASGTGLDANSTTITIRRDSDNNYWTGTEWGAKTDLNTTHDATNDGSPTNWTYDSSGVGWEDGNTYTIVATATDKAGNTFEGDPATFTYDTSDPDSAAEIDKEVYGPSTWSDTDTIKGTASDASGIAEVTITIQRDSDNHYWDGTGEWVATDENLPVTEDCDNGECTWTYDATGITLHDGNTYTVTPTATDNAGNTATGTPDEFTYDETEPDIVSIIADKYFYKNQDTIELIVTTDAEAAEYTVTADFSEIDSEAVTEIICDSIDDIAYQCLHTISAGNTTEDGVKTITVTVKNNAGNTAQDTIDLDLDNTDPTVFVVIIPDGFYGPETWEHNPDDILNNTLWGTVDDGPETATRIEKVTITIVNDSNGGAFWDGGEWVSEEANLNATLRLDLKQWYYPLDSANLADGNSYTITPTAEDKAGNTTEGLSRTFTYDSSPPINATINIEDYTADNPQMTLFAEDELSGMKDMAFSCNDSDWSDWVAYATAHNDFNIISGDHGCTDIEDGEKTVYVKFRDDVNNESDSESNTTYLDTTAPEIDFNLGSQDWTGTAYYETITATDTDGSGVVELYYAKVDWGDSCPTKESGDYNLETTAVDGNIEVNVTINQDGEWRLCAYAVDGVGNESFVEESGEYKFDAGPPYLLEEQSTYDHSSRELVLKFDDLLIGGVNYQGNIHVSNEEGQGSGDSITLGTEDSCTHGETTDLTCVLSVVHRDIIQGWYADGYRILYIYVEEGAVTDKAENENEDTNTTVIEDNWTPKPQGNLTLSEGWNFISIPFELEDKNAIRVLGLETEDEIHYYYNGSWNTPTELEALKGYLVYKDSVGTRPVTFDYVSGVQAVPPSITVMGNRWNMIGPDTPTTMELTKFLPNTGANAYNYIDNKVWTYNNSDGAWENESEDLNFGIGYFVYFRSTATIAGSPAYTVEEVD